MRRALGWTARAGLLVGLNGLLLWGLSAILPGIGVPSFWAALVGALVIGLVNAVLWPIVTRILLPLTLLTLGLASIVLNAIVVEIALGVVDGTDPTFAASVTVAFGMAAVSAAVQPLLDFEGDAYHLRVVRRRVRHARERNETDIPGVVFFEIDGLAEPILRQAIRDGQVPTMARWLEDGSHRLIGWECDLSSQTGASQAGLLQGSNFDMPAFRWYEKERGEMMVSNRVRDAAEIERRHTDGAGLLAEGGTSRGNLLSGDAPRCTLTMAAVRDRTRSQARDFYSYFVDPYGFMRTFVLCLHDIALELRAARRQRRSGAEHVHRGGTFPLARCAITVAMRDLNTAMLMADIVEGVPVTYATFVGYDEVAHHAGIAEPDALAVLSRLDTQLGRLEGAIRDAPRPYHLVVLSDHGQTQGRPFRQRYGQTLEEVVREAVDASVQAPPPVREDWGHLGGVLADVRQDPSLPGRVVHRLTRDRMVEDTVALGPEREAMAGEAALAESDADVIVLASGNLGLVYLTAAPERLTLEAIEERYPGLVGRVAGHEGVGFVMVRSDVGGPVAVGADGLHFVAIGRIEGTDPLKEFPPTTADHLRRHDSFPHCPDLLVNSMFDPEAGEVAPFEEFMGSHGGLGGLQSHPFALVPSSWSEPSAPIVGVEAMHNHLRGWLQETGQKVKPRP